MPTIQPASVKAVGYEPVIISEAAASGYAVIEAGIMSIRKLVDSFRLDHLSTVCRVTKI
jgi:hypothetical protein